MSTAPSEHGKAQGGTCGQKITQRRKLLQDTGDSDQTHPAGFFQAKGDQTPGEDGRMVVLGT